MTLQIVEFLLSENGKFLKASIISELVDTIDSLGLTAVTIASLATNGFFPLPPERPDKTRVEQFLKLVGIITNTALLRLGSPNNSRER